MILINYFNKIKGLYLKYEKFLLPISFFIGLFWDNFTLRRPDLPYENAVFVWNLFQSVFLIVLINAFQAGRLKGKIAERIIPFFPLFLQFSFGNLFSGFIVFYIRSGSILASWPFILILGILFVGNEFFRKRYAHLPFQTGILFISIFSYLVFALPVLLNKMGDLVFLASGGLALLSISVIIFLIFYATKQSFRASLKYVVGTVGSIYLIFNILYFTNIIPPIPLILKEVIICHSIEQQKEGSYIYKVTFEPASGGLSFLKDQSDIFHMDSESSIYAYSAIFSPADLNIPIFHRWMRFDENSGKWIKVADVSFNITGGRINGYRGYSYILNAVPGKWRVDVMTERGQILGRRIFTAVKNGSIPVLEAALK